MPDYKLTDTQVQEILAARAYDQPRPSYPELSRRYQVSIKTIQYICNRISRQSVPIPKPPEGFEAEDEK
jgi:hypothetical protein